MHGPSNLQSFRRPPFIHAARRSGHALAVVSLPCPSSSRPSRLPATMRKLRLIELEQENTRLKKAVSDLTLDQLILQKAAKGNW
jgi:hypothetical protein